MRRISKGPVAERLGVAVDNEASTLSGEVRRRGFNFVFLSAMLALLFSTYAFAESASDTYKKKCSACHGAKGAGDTLLGKNLKLRPLNSPEVQDKSDAEITMIIGKGRNKMPRFDDKLSKDQIRALVEYVRSLKH
ncbi:MAG: cytochrome c [Terriglobales bacterium]